MPLFDQRSDAVVLRVVYDGPPEAGKTTNLVQLCSRISLNRRGNLASPDNVSPRTAFFDWLDVEGGYVGGRRIRCQLVTVPGQPELLRRRRYLLRSADVVVFVADGHPDQLALNRRLLDELSRLLGDERAPVGVVLQANKQDQPGALQATDLRSALGLAEGVPAIGAQASIGNGVLETFMLAVRLAVDRVRGLLVRGELDSTRPSDATPESLHGALRQLETEREEADAALVRLAERAAKVVTSPLPVLPRGDVPAGLVWPPLAGRSVLQRLVEAGPAVRAAVPFADPRAIGLEVGDAWIACTPPEAFSDSETARRAFCEEVRLQAALGELGPPGRTVAVAPDGDGWRLWMLTPRPSPLPPETSVRDVLVRCLELERRRGLKLSLAPTQFALLDGELRYLGPIAVATEARTATVEALLGAFVAEPMEEPDLEEPRIEAPEVQETEVEIEEVAVAVEPAPTPPRIDIPAGLVWPPVKGRSTLAAIQGLPITAVAPPSGWTYNLRCGDFQLQSRKEWQFDDPDAGRLVLMDEVRLLGRLGPFLPEGRTLALAAEAHTFRLWAIGPLLQSLRDRLDAATAAHDLPTVTELLRRLATACAELCARAETHQLGIVPSAENLSACGAAYLGLVAAPTGERPRPAAVVVHELERALTAQPASRAVLVRLVRRAFSDDPALTLLLAAW